MSGVQHGFQFGTRQVQQVLLFQIVGVAIGNVLRVQSEEEMRRARAPIGVHAILAQLDPFRRFVSGFFQ